MRRNEWIGLGLWVAVCFGASAVGAVFTPGEWYAALRKPSWNPPAWVFAPVWTVLYLMMAISAWLVWRQGGLSVQRRPLGLFLLQLALNAAWSPLFFGLHWVGAAFVETLLLLLAIVGAIRAFHRVDRVAAGLMVPYLGWVSFASVLNFSIWRLNK
jgi:tryptophan-rich sensory protein